MRFNCEATRVLASTLFVWLSPAIAGYSFVVATEPVATYRHDSKVQTIVFDGTSRLLAGGTADGSVSIWNLKNHKLVCRLDPPEGRFFGYKWGTKYDPVEGLTPPIVTSLSFHPTANVLLVAYQSGKIRLWDLRRRKVLRTAQIPPRPPVEHRITVGNFLEAMACSPTGKLFVGGTSDGVLRIWSYPQAKQVGQMKAHTGAIFALSFSNDGALLASGGADNRITIWDVNRHRLVATLLGHQHIIKGVAITSDKQYLFSCSSTGGLGIEALFRKPKRSEEVFQWDLKNKKRIARLSGMPPSAYALALSPDGRYLACAGGSAYWRTAGVYVWRIRNRKLIAVLHAHQPVGPDSVAFSPDGRFLATCSEDKTIRLWRVRDVLK